MIDKRDGRHGLAQVLAVHVAEHADLQQQAHQGREQEARGHRQEPGVRVLADHPADIGAQQVERAVRQVDVAQQAEHQGEAAGDQEIERGEREAVQRGGEEQPLVVDDAPDRERQQRQAEQPDPEPAADEGNPVMRLVPSPVIFLSPARGERRRRGGIDVRCPLTQPLPLAGERSMRDEAPRRHRRDHHHATDCAQRERAEAISGFL